MQQEEEAEDRRDRRRVEAEIAGRTIWDAAAIIGRIKRDSRRSDDSAESKETFSSKVVKNESGDLGQTAAQRHVPERSTSEGFANLRVVRFVLLLLLLLQ